MHVGRLAAREDARQHAALSRERLRLCYTEGVSASIEPAPTGRAKCRACGRPIARGELRVGERGPNPFGDGDATFWFHLVCAACKRPEAAAEVLAGGAPELRSRPELVALIEAGLAHPRLARIAGIQRSPSGRARCRHCHTAIDGGRVRIALDHWEEGRFGGAGYLHPGCARAYFGEVADVVERARRCDPELDPALLDELARELSTSG